MDEAEVGFLFEASDDEVMIGEHFREAVLLRISSEVGKTLKTGLGYFVVSLS